MRERNMDQVQIPMEGYDECYEKMRRLKDKDEMEMVASEAEKAFVMVELQEAIEKGNVNEFVNVLENLCLERKLGLSAIFGQVMTPTGNSLLHEAAYFGKEKIAQLIGDHFPHLLTHKNKKGDTPLHIAAISNGYSRSSVIKVILSQCKALASPYLVTSLTNEYGNTALHESVISKHVNVEVVKLLFEADQSVTHSLNHSGKSPLFLAVISFNHEIVHTLLGAPFPPDKPLPNCLGNSPLHAAIYTHNAALIEEILREKSELMYSRDEEGGTPLHYAACRGYIEGARVLLRHSHVLPFVQNAKGHFPIHLACKWGHVSMVHLLLEQKCADDPRLYVNKKGQNILHNAAKNGQHKVVKCILKNKKVEHIINERDNDGNTPLHLASQNPFPSIVFSLTRNKKIDVNIMNNKGFTARDILWMQMEEKTISRGVWLSKTVLDSVDALESDKARSMIRKQHGILARKVEWKDRVNTLMVVTILIATVTFAAAFTVPGGVYSSDDDNSNNSNTKKGAHKAAHKIGKAVFAKTKTFQVFVGLDGLAMVSSIVGLIVLLWAQYGDIQLAERSVMYAFALVGAALASMTLAFTTALSLIISDSLSDQLSYAIIAIIIFSAVYFVYLLGIFPLPLPPNASRINDLLIRINISLYATPPKLKASKLQKSESHLQGKLYS